jgi:hypothetical protein
MKYIIGLYKTNKLAFWIALVYDGIGTLTVCSISPADRFYGDWSLPFTLITMPVNYLSFIYRFAQFGPLYPVYIIQFIMFFLTFWFLKSRINKRQKKNKVKDLLF